MHRDLRLERSFLLRCAILLALVGCSAMETGTPTLASLDRQMALWESSRPERYRFDLAWFTSGGIPEVMPIRVEVEGDSVRSVSRVPLPADPETESELTMDWGMTVEDLFDTLRDMIERSPDRLDVTWHRRHGFPVEIDFDLRFTASDTRRVYRVNRFTRLD